MADFAQRLPGQVSGRFYVDDTCIYCDLCREMAPSVFRYVAGQGVAVVHRQPETDEELARAREAIEGCPTESIGSDGDPEAPPVQPNPALERTGQGWGVWSFLQRLFRP